MSKTMSLARISSLVLVVEDDEEIASLLEKYLVRAGYRTTKASTGRTALAHVQKLQPDLILLDIGLPDMENVWTDVASLWTNAGTA
ncbi:response regulator [Rhizobium sp. 32-5/1]|uniref:response regulator n=1 Tax=Rhizobium sp. 32-5/1 TaxID=3019602 RepID=UPI00240DA62C|nr:response regulator [Rhizobium sp. 32-5/1]WEZ84485.1 response regulator [Rhizobium sp. 32-5/1]